MIENAMQPDLSILLLIGPQRRRAERALQSILAQTILDRIEVIVMDCSAAEFSPIPGSEHPAVRVLPFSVQDGGGHVRGESVRQACGPIVYFVEDHVTIAPDAAEAVLSAMEGPWAALCGSMRNGNPEMGISEVIALMNYTRWLAPSEGGEAELLVGHNCAFRRDVLLHYERRLDQLLGSEVALQWEMRRDGHRLFSAADVCYTHWNEYRLGSIVRGFYLVNRTLGRLQAESLQWSLARRIAMVLLTPLRIGSRVAKSIGEVQGKRPEKTGYFLRHLMTVILVQAAGVIGLTLSLVFGPGDSDVRFLTYEVTEPRMPDEVQWVPS